MAWGALRQTGWDPQESAFTKPTALLHTPAGWKEMSPSLRWGPGCLSLLWGFTGALCLAWPDSARRVAKWWLGWCVGEVDWALRGGESGERLIVTEHQCCKGTATFLLVNSVLGAYTWRLAGAEDGWRAISQLALGSFKLKGTPRGTQGASRGRERGWCAAQLLSSLLHLQVTEVYQTGWTPNLCCLQWCCGAPWVPPQFLTSLMLSRLSGPGVAAQWPDSYCRCRRLLEVVMPVVPSSDTCHTIPYSVPVRPFSVLSIGSRWKRLFRLAFSAGTRQLSPAVVFPL